VFLNARLALFVHQTGACQLKDQQVVPGHSSAANIHPDIAGFSDQYESCLQAAVGPEKVATVADLSVV